MSIKAVMAEVLQAELMARGIESLALSDYEQIVERLVEQISELELKMAARGITDKNKP
ncbi:hypothetical protein Q3C01_09380 [Bradyrhizobium sp. UFLA05-109]